MKAAAFAQSGEQPQIEGAMHLAFQQCGFMQSKEETDGIATACKEAGVQFMDGTM